MSMSLQHDPSTSLSLSHNLLGSWDYGIMGSQDHIHVPHHPWTHPAAPHYPRAPSHLIPFSTLHSHRSFSTAPPPTMVTTIPTIPDIPGPILDHAGQVGRQEEPHGAQQADNDEHPQEDPVDHHGHVFPVFLHLPAEKGLGIPFPGNLLGLGDHPELPGNLLVASGTTTLGKLWSFLRNPWVGVEVSGVELIPNFFGGERFSKLREKEECGL